MYQKGSTYFGLEVVILGGSWELTSTVISTLIGVKSHEPLSTGAVGTKYMLLHHMNPPGDPTPDSYSIVRGTPPQL